MWRRKAQDLDSIAQFLDDLASFKSLKTSRWELVDETIQQANQLGVPSEDWIIPPDENLTLKELEKDPDYVRLRRSITQRLPSLKAIAVFNHFNTHHQLDWMTFSAPLIGNDTLDEVSGMVEKLFHVCNHRSYFFTNLTKCFQIRH